MGSSVYVLDTHATHSSPLAPVYPCKHSHDKIEVLATGELELARQASQDCLGWLACMLLVASYADCKSAVDACSSAVSAEAIRAKTLFGRW